MLIHEVRRRADEAPEHVFAGRKLAFKANAAGDVVCDVPDEIAQDLLDATGGAMVAYGVTASPTAAPAPAPKVAKAAAAASSETPPAGDQKPSGEGGDASQSDGTGEGGAQASKFSITSPDGETFDLEAMNDAEVRAFAKKNGLPNPHHTKKGDVLRQLVIDALKAE